MNRFYLSVLICCITSFVFAGDTEPESTAAKQAISKATKSIADADHLWRDSVVKADKQLIADLKAAKAAAMKSDSLEEANAIKAVIETTENDLANLESDSPTSAKKLAAEVINAKWKYKGEDTVGIYRNDGKVRYSGWNGDGTWKILDANTIEQVEPNGIAERITFASDRQRALWIYTNRPGTAWIDRSN